MQGSSDNPNHKCNMMWNVLTITEPCLLMINESLRDNKLPFIEKIPQKHLSVQTKY